MDKYEAIQTYFFLCFVLVCLFEDHTIPQKYAVTQL